MGVTLSSEISGSADLPISSLFQLADLPRIYRAIPKTDGDSFWLTFDRGLNSEIRNARGEAKKEKEEEEENNLSGRARR